MSNTTLRQMAKQAKERLKNGKLYGYQSKQKLNMSRYSQLINFQTVIDMVESEEIIANPIKRLMDKDYYETLSDTAKQRYILNIAEDYIAIKKKYLESKSIQEINYENRIDRAM